MSEKILEIRHLSKTFGTNLVLKDIDFTVNSKDVTCIIGASGSGKSTLLRCLNLLETPTTGEILYHGNNIADAKVNAPKYRSRVGMVFQSFNLFNNMDVLDNCTLAPVTLKKMGKAEAEKVARRVVESGKHRLISDYETVWKNTCNGIWDAGESLIEVSFYSPTGLDSDNTAGRIGKWNGVSATTIDGERGRNAANWKVVYTFTRDWEAQNDPRMKLSIADYKYDHTLGSGPITYFSTISSANPSEDQKNRQRQLFTPGKWDTEKYVETSNYIVNNDKSNVNWYILRYSDVLLLFAEALNESGGSIVDAVDAVNAVRRRGFGDTKHDLSYGLSREDLREAIRKERAYELCFEGHRKQDLIRWGIYYDRVMETAQELVNWYSNANYAVARYIIKGRHELLPIPQRDLDMMPKCKQNSGWGQ